MAKATCSIDGCEKDARTKGWCPMHYARWLRYGSTDTVHNKGPLRRTEADRFWAKVDKSRDCWVWTASRYTTGYGCFTVGPPWRRIMAHRWAYEYEVGPIPDGLQLDHLCRNRACVNPSHLEPVTQHENILRGDAPSAIHARKTHCAKGHAFTPDNVYLTKAGKRCRACTLELNRQSAERRRQRS